MRQIIYTTQTGKIEVGQTPPFYLSKIDGLGFENNIYTSRGIYQDGESYVTSNLAMRDIDLTIMAIGKDINYYIEQVYKAFNPKYEGTFYYFHEGTNRKAYCRVANVSHKFDSGHVMFYISLVCTDPHFYELDETVVGMAVWEKGFYFPVPFGIEPVVFGLYNDNNIRNLINNGNVEIYPRLEFNATDNVVNPSVINVYTREHIKLMTTLKKGDIISIDSKTKRITQNGVNIFNKRVRGSSFFPLHQGDNIIQFDAEIGKENLEVRVIYNNAYLGV